MSTLKKKTESTFCVSKVNYMELQHVQFYANEPFSCNFDQTITKLYPLQFQTIYDTCLYLEW